MGSLDSEDQDQDRDRDREITDRVAADQGGEDRIAKLEARIDELEERQSRSKWSRRGMLGLLGVGGVASLSGNAAAGSNQVGTIGTQNKPIDVIGEDIEADNVAPRSIASDYLYAAEFSGGDPDTRLDNCLNAASTGTTIYLEAGDYTRNRTISTPGLDFIGAGGNRNGTGISATITLDASFTHIRHVVLRDTNVTQGDIILNGGEFARHLVMGMIFGDVTINSGTKRSIVALTRNTNITDNGTGNQLVGNV